MAFAYIHKANDPIPIVFPMDDDGVAWIPEVVLSQRFDLLGSSMWIEQLVHEGNGLEMTSTIVQPRSKNGEESMWKLQPGSYRVSGVDRTCQSRPMEMRTPGFTPSFVEDSIFATVKVEPSDCDRILLSDDEDVVMISTPTTFVSPVTSTSMDPGSTSALAKHTSMSNSRDSRPPVHLVAKPFANILDVLLELKSRRRGKSDLKFLKLEGIRFERVKFLPQSFNGDVLFELPPLQMSSTSSIGQQLEGMDKRHDGHAWTSTFTTNIVNDHGLTFRYTMCLGHLICENRDCPRLRRSGTKNETEWEGKSSHVFVPAEMPPTRSTVVCRLCKVPPSCIRVCPARMYRILNTRGLPRGCLHVGTHDHPVANGVCRESLERTTSLVSQELSRTPSAKNSAIALAASKEFLAKEVFGIDGEEAPAPLRGDALVAVMENFRILSSPSIRNVISNSRPAGSLGPIDSIMALKQKSPYAYIQDSIFPGQGKEKVYLFKMSEEGPGSGVNLVKRMQLGGDLENSWLMFDHVKRVKGWTTMACHVYDPEYCRIMTVAVCDMMSEDAIAQSQMWRSLNAVMERHGILCPYFKGFMADNAQANWNAVRQVYNNGDVMVDRERSCLLHWTTSLNRHTDKLIKPELREAHKRLCKQYKDAKTMEEAEQLYLGIKGWWLSSRAASEDGLRELDDWLAFWHFRYRQWGGFLELNLNLEELAEMPSCNLAETVHNKWLQMSGNRGTCLYVATSDDMMRAMMQSTNYWAYLQGHASGTGPRLDELRLRAARRSKDPKKLVAAMSKLTNAEVFTTRVPHLEGEEVFGSAKRKLNMPPGSDGDSHRHDKVNFSRSKVQTRSTRARTEAGTSSGVAVELSASPPRPHATSILETECNPNAWHIARCRMSGKKCDGLQVGQKKKCGGHPCRDSKTGTPAPTYSGRKTDYVTRAIVSTTFWFCADDMQRCVGGSKVKWVHDWPPIPDLWPVARGTRLTKSEILSLEEAGFQLQTREKDISPHRLFRTSDNNYLPSTVVPCPSGGGSHPTKRFGRTIRRSPNVPTIDQKNKWETARNVKATVKNVATIPYPGYGRIITLASGVPPSQRTYHITLSDFPACTCEDFVTTCAMAKSSRKVWVNCKHLYYVYRFHCKANSEDDKFIHAPSLSFDEVQQLLRGSNL